jgi:eukaryotic-like serine/threonine-protein kinase
MRLIPVQQIPAPAPPAPPPAAAPAAPAAPVEPAAQAPPPVTERRIGKYIVKGELGRGGMGAVYLAEQPGLGREVAIKELILSAVADPTALKRFMQEAQVMARTSHPNLVQVHDLEQIGDANYIVLEFVRGKSLRDRINLGPLPLPQTFAVMHGVLQALDYAHKRSIVHRDMKPENVLMSEEGEVKVADFGIARLTDDSGAGSTATKTGTTVGTPQYMSPEQVASSKVDGRSDLYSAGIMFYELVVGQPPFTASEADGPFTLMAKHVQAPPKPPSVHRPGLDMGLEEVILKSLSKRPEERYQTGQEFDDAMSRVAERLCPGWQRSLLPGADLAKMVPGGASVPGTNPAVAGMPIMPSASPIPAQPVQSVYNPTPPVRPVAKKSAGCLGLFGSALGLLPLLGVLVALLLR